MEGCFVVSKKKRKRLFSFYLKSPSATGWSSKRLTCEATVRIWSWGFHSRMLWPCTWPQVT